MLIRWFCRILWVQSSQLVLQSQLIDLSFFDKFLANEVLFFKSDQLIGWNKIRNNLNRITLLLDMLDWRTDSCCVEKYVIQEHLFKLVFPQEMSGLIQAIRGIFKKLSWSLAYRSLSLFLQRCCWWRKSEQFSKSNSFHDKALFSQPNHFDNGKKLLEQKRTIIEVFFL